MDDGRPLRVRVLGPIEVRDDAGDDVTPDGALQRRLLALLVLHRDRVVGADEALEALWPGGPPRDPAAALQTHVFRLRRSLPGLHIRSTDAGYCLTAASVDVDADRLEDALRRAVAGDSTAGDELDALLRGWSGAAYPELADTDAGRAEGGRLDELRTAATERRAESRLAAGATDGLVAELAALVDADPLRERPRLLLMEALAATGRTVEALRVYDSFRRTLGDELGIEPSAELTERHERLLRGVDDDRWRPATVLPVALTSLVGRDELLERCEALAREHRLVSLVGPGGVGKTRLLLELGQRIRAATPDRSVVLCELASAAPDSALDAVAVALGIEGRPGQGIGDRLPQLLADAELTLLLDNCEHVLAPIATLTERVLASGPGVRVLATSQERLRVPGEQVCPVPTLPSGDEHGPAEALFVERATAVDPDFHPTDDDRPLIGEIVRRLDGLPLAIELAAARLRTMDLAGVAAGLDRRFRVLDTGSRANPRHGSLHAAISWSVDTLPGEIRDVFATSSVFSNPFRVDDVAAVGELAPSDAAAALDLLVERSLVERAPGGRYALLESLRAFGAELLGDGGRARRVRPRHARHSVEWAEHVDRTMDHPGQQDGLLAIDRELPELRTALAWLLEGGELDLAGRLVVALEEYGWLRMRTDVLGWADQVVAADPDDRGSWAPQVWIASAITAWLSGDMDAARRRADRARALGNERGGEVPGRVRHWQGTMALFSGRLDDAVRHYREAREADADHPGRRLTSLGTEVLALAYAGDDRAADETVAAMLAEVDDREGPHAAFAWYCAGEADLNVDLDRARARFARALEIADATGNAFVSGIAGTSDASIDLRRGDHHQAARRYRALLVHWRRAGVWSTQWTSLRSVAMVLEGLGRTREAAVLTGAVLATRAGHDVFGEDAVALATLQGRLRAALGERPYEAAMTEGAELDGDAAVELALGAL